MLSFFLVAMQFLAILALLVLPPMPDWSIPCVGLIALGAALGVWVLAFNRIGNFNIRPEPRQGGALITSGPYRFMRHPMYTAVLLVCGGIAWGSLGGKSAAWLGLAVVLAAKALVEESRLRQVYPGYAAYCASTRRFIPYLI